MCKNDNKTNKINQNKTVNKDFVYFVWLNKLLLLHLQLKE